MKTVRAARRLPPPTDHPSIRHSTQTTEVPDPPRITTLASAPSQVVSEVERDWAC